MDLLVTAAMFGSEGMRIDYIDKRFKSDESYIESSLTMPIEGYEQLVDDIKEALADIVDEYQIQRREPPDTLPAGPRLKQSAPRPTEKPIGVKEE